jgi:peptidoglycan/LPS O-acetylase OafA/YrhL
MTDNKNSLNWVQLLRGVAALLVVLTHARYALQNTASYPIVDQMLAPGALGVDLFFIISGFIMCYATAGADGSPAYVARFVIKRFARVWPAYAAAVLLAVVVIHDGVGYFHAADNRRAFWHTLGMLPFDPRHAPYFGLTLVIAWTLEFEMYFYLVFAASLLFKRLRWLALAAWVLLTVFVLPLGRRGFDMDITRDLGYSTGYLSIVTSPFVLEFAAGVLIGWIYQQKWARIRSAPVARHVMWLGAAFALWAIYSHLIADHGPTRYGWPLALMMLCVALGSKTVELRVPALCMWLGSISYSLYLTHLITQNFVMKTLVRVGLEPLFATWSYVLLSTVCALSFAALFHHYLERGLSDIVRHRLLGLVTARPAAPTLHALPAAGQIVRKTG